jgi:hypothetical protein
MSWTELPMKVLKVTEKRVLLSRSGSECKTCCDSPRYYSFKNFLTISEEMKEEYMDEYECERKQVQKYREILKRNVGKWVAVAFWGYGGALTEMRDIREIGKDDYEEWQALNR